MNSQLIKQISNILQKKDGQLSNKDLFSLISLIALIKIIDIYEDYQTINKPEQNINEQITSTQNNQLTQLISQLQQGTGSNQGTNIQQMLPLLLNLLNNKGNNRDFTDKQSSPDNNSNNINEENTEDKKENTEKKKSYK